MSLRHQNKHPTAEKSQIDSTLADGEQLAKVVSLK